MIFAKSNMEYGSEQLSTSINIASSNFTGNFGGAILLIFLVMIQLL